MPRPIDALVRPFIHHVHPYIPGKPIEELKRELDLPDETDILKLASNENVLGVSPKALAVILAKAHEVWLYPEDSCFYIREALAAHHGVEPANIYMGNGGVACLRDLGQLFLGPEDQAIAAGPSFMKYRIVSQWAHDLETPMTERHFCEVSHPDFIHDVEAMGRAIGDATKLVWVCNPNNPTGQMLNAAEVERLLELNDDRALVVLDEAYAEFVEAGMGYPDSIEYVKRGHQVVVMRTLAKIAGLAGLRLGYLVGSKELIAYLDRIRLTFSINRLAQQAAVAALGDEEFRAATRALVWGEKRYYYERCDALGWEYKPTQGNFIFMRTGLDGDALCEGLMRRGVIVRPGKIFAPECRAWVRVTFGTRAMNERFFEAAVGVVKVAGVQMGVGG